jgi:phytoene synthase
MRTLKALVRNISTQVIDTETHGSLRQYGKTFYFAGLFLEAKTLDEAARLYAFCRYIDDIADTSKDPTASMLKLKAIFEELKGTESSNQLVADFIHLKNSTQIDVEAAKSLVTGAISDLNHSQIKDTNELIRYCYQVAGTVGIMMCSILKIRDPNAHKFAIDLGIAMQLTNIARDIHEDAKMNRLYLPQVWIGNITTEEIKDNHLRTLQPIAAATEKLLLLADSYYTSGYSGLIHIPQRSKIAITIAATVYQAIGITIKKRQFNPFMGRAVVPYRWKLFYAFKILLRELLPFRNKRSLPRHNAKLHLPINSFLSQ